MKQVLLSGKGQVEVLETPIPGPMTNSLLVRNAYSLISSGTEGSAVTSRKGWLGVYEKIAASPERLTQVWNFAKSHGVSRTLAAVQSKLEGYSSLGYSCAGTVVEVSNDEMPFVPGDRVACMGSGLASHAEYVVIPKNLAVVVPPTVMLEEAAFAALACIAMQGVRRLDLSPGERVGVIGLGLIGRLTLRLLRVMGYEPFGMDINPERSRMAQEVDLVESWALSSISSEEKVRDLTNGRGLDGVVICAATHSQDPINLAFALLRHRGRVSIVGDVGLHLEREKMYSKELEVRMSCSYGPGRYDPLYEAKGDDYPFSFVRWTERRNLEYFVNLLTTSRLDLRPLISARYPVEDASAAYARLKAGQASDYGILFQYASPSAAVNLAQERVLKTAPPVRAARPGRVRVALIGTGAYANAVHIPNLKQLADQFEIYGVASRSGVSAAVTGRKAGASVVTSDYRRLLEDANVDAVLIATRHSNHAAIALDALRAGKHVFVEKPLATTVDEACQVKAVTQETGLILRVGFNRRFSPFMTAMRQVVGQSGTRIFSARINVGSLGQHWSNTAEEGGRLLGEGIHFFDLCNWFMAVPLVEISGQFAGEVTNVNPNASVQLRYTDGSMGHILYTISGNSEGGKEYYEAFGNGKFVRSEDFTTFSAYGSSVRVPRRERGNKGQLAELMEFEAAIRGESYPVEGADAHAGAILLRLALEVYKRAAMGTVIKFNLPLREGYNRYLWLESADLSSLSLREALGPIASV